MCQIGTVVREGINIFVPIWLNGSERVNGNEWEADCKTLFKLYTSLIKPILEYGCESFDSAATYFKERLDSFQYQALKTCARAIRSTALTHLQIECGDPLSNYVVNYYAIYME